MEKMKKMKKNEKKMKKGYNKRKIHVATRLSFQNKEKKRKTYLMN